MSRKEQEKHLLRQLHAGNLKLIMHGQKIKGEFALFQMKGRGERSWILMKKKDEYATDKDILAKDKSVMTGKTLVQVAADHGTTVNHPEGPKKQAKKSPPVRLLPAEKKVAKEKTSGKTSSASRIRSARGSTSVKKKSLN
jgi:bifunctional non-homologous end joining protein LigD